jgi:hypothetical protein
MKEPISRRQTLATLGSGLVVGLAGCSGDGNDGSSGGSDGSTSGSDGSSGSSSDGTGGSSDGSSGSGGSDGSDSEGKSLTFTIKGGAKDSFETLVISLDSMTFQSADGGDSPTLQGSETTVDLTTLGTEKSAPLIEGAQLPYGSYDTVTLEMTIEEAAKSDGSSPEFDSTTVEQSLVINDSPATVEESRFDANISVYVVVRGSGPYQLGSTGWQGTGL